MEQETQDHEVHTNGKEETPENGVLVHSSKTDDGRLTVSLRIVGNLDPLAIPALLEHAVKVARQNIGLAP